MIICYKHTNYPFDVFSLKPQTVSTNFEFQENEILYTFYT